MAFFKKKTKSNQDGGRLPLVVAVDDVEPKAVAFGVSWRAVASRSSTRADAIKIARSGGATHLISTLQQFGYGLVPADAAPAGTRVFAAARVAARQHGGDAIYALKLFPEGNEYWFAVIRGGQPSSIDRVILSDNDMELIEAARKEIESGLEDDISYAVFTNLEDHDLSDKARGLTAQDLMLAASGEEDVLQPLPKKSGDIPKPVIAVVGVAVLLAAGNKGWGMYQEKERKRLARINASVEEPPEQAWALAMQAWADGHRAADPQGLSAVRVSLGSVPLVWGGWEVQSATCTAVPPAASQPGAAAQGDRHWGCSAIYTRSQFGRVNREMKQSTPDGWTVQYKGLDTLVGSWNVTHASQPFKFEALRSVENHMVETVSRLQKLSAAFGQVGDLTFVPVEIKPPRKGDGTAVAMVASVPQVRAATFTLKAPLRSIDALIDAGVEADWLQINMYFKRADGEKVDIKTSALTADVKAVIYAKP
ncbi:type 4b pilus protein PilO2 [Variovorax ginsengisoli]|uniref:Type 4b pilus protein PilO2 n=1 Tax=Variovorax ginsengisoli TaxID=363844 RepID=A0ABT8SA55_9BURK|nr:type 4b pilus protein PilO2 [Variovorax ginsengisoli]MDN8616503.1 type 4b pilus protein PilO2 [Variovorax ginsengisoli]MDO1535673.1 type 4b pilus protein PilO2 [Variovorax ginsengisoli]